MRAWNRSDKANKSGAGRALWGLRGRCDGCKRGIEKDGGQGAGASAFGSVYLDDEALSDDGELGAAVQLFAADGECGRGEGQADCVGDKGRQGIRLERAGGTRSCA